MRVLLISKFGQGVIKETNIIPRLGDKVCLFYQPYPTVTNIIFWPDESLKKEFGFTENIDVIITLD